MRALTKLTGLPTAAHWFLAGTLASNIGNGMHTLAAGALLYQQTGSIAAFGVVVVIEQVVTVLMQAVAGPMVDRGDPRRAAMLAEIARGLGVCGLSLLLTVGDGNALPLVLAMTVLIRVVHTFHRAGTFALTPALVPATDLTRLNSWFSACQQGGQLIGIGMTGFIVALWGAPAAFFINGTSFLVSAATLAALASTYSPPIGPPADDARPFWRVIVAGWSEFANLVCRDLRLAGLILASTADNVAAIVFNLILAPLVWERLAASPTWLSLIAGGFAFGAMAASALTAALAERFGTRGAALVGIAGQMLCFATLWWSDRPVPMLLLAGLLGACNTISWTTLVTTVQLAAPPAVRGRLAMARNALTAAIVAPLVPLIASVSQWFSPAAPLLAASGVCAAFLLIAAVSIRGRCQAADVAVLPAKSH